MKSPLTFFFLLGAFSLFAQTFSWTEQQSGVTTSLKDVFFADDQSGWAVGDNGTIVHTSDSGQTWSTQTSNTSERLDAVHFIDASTGWAVGSQSTALVLKTTDGGATWNELPNNFQNIQIRDVFFTDANTGWIIFRDSIFQSVDGGVSWVQENYHPDIANGGLNSQAVFATSVSTAFICGAMKPSSSPNRAAAFNRRSYNNTFVFSADGVNDFVGNEELSDICFTNPTTGFIAGEQRVYKMESDGISFSGPWLLNHDVGSIISIRAISFPSEDVGMFLGGTSFNQVNYGLVHHTSDGGDNWTSTPDSIADLLPNKLHAPVIDNAWVVGSLGKIFKGIRIPVGTKDFDNLVGLEVFPNPFDDNFTINISLDQPENLVIKLSNINGQKVYENSYDLSQGDTSFELKNLDKLGSGIYFLNVYSENGDFLASKKVLKF